MAGFLTTPSTAAILRDRPKFSRSQGAEVADEGVRYRTWCKHDRVTVAVLDDADRVCRTVALEAEGDGYFSGLDAVGQAGDLYKYRFGESQLWPDPASRFQPRGVHGPSMVVDPRFDWRDEGWIRPQLSDLVIYEIHIGTFTQAGTFRAAIERLPHLAALGITAIEIMPIADFPGERNWGYDDVMLYAPARAYGPPVDLRALIDAAHSHGIAVILDAVYNHFGPDGNYTGVFHSGYSDPKRETPWGKALNYGCTPVRDFFIQNASYWMYEFHIDGFRLDATHSISDDSPTHILAQIAEAVQARGGFIIAEDERNEPALLRPRTGGGLGFDGVWADVFHHVVRVLLTKERVCYYANFEGTSDELAQTIAHGWLFRGQTQPASGEPRGGDSLGLAPHQFTYCITNHDQVGNRAFGERLGQVVTPAAYRAASALLCLVPQTPLLFMGQEWSASTPFQFFTDHKGELGTAITHGRRREFQSFAAFRDPTLRETIPDPQAASTFENSRLNWDELKEPKHSGVLLLYSELLRIRRTTSAFRRRTGESFVAINLGPGVIAILFGRVGHYEFGVVSDLVGGGVAPNMEDPRLAPGDGHDWERVLSSNERRFGGDDSLDFNVPTSIAFVAG
ncbi:MAG: malto-oligosyltrehalose trehalohydrolase [Chthoniobacterales bacterium]